MSNQQEKISYLLTFNVNIYAETRGNQPQPMFDHEGCSVIQYMKGETLEISEESFMLFIEYGRCSNLTTTPITGIPCVTDVRLCQQLRSWGCRPRASGFSGLPDHLIT